MGKLSDQTARLKALELCSGAKYTPHGQNIYNKSGHRFIDVRAWGHLTSPNFMNLSDEDAAKVQDALGNFIADAINKAKAELEAK